VSTAKVRWKEKNIGAWFPYKPCRSRRKTQPQLNFGQELHVSKVSVEALFGGDTKRSEGGLGAAYKECSDPGDGTSMGTRHPFRLLRPSDLGALKWGFNALHWTMDEWGVTFVFRVWCFGVKNRWNREQKVQPWCTFRSVSERECPSGRRPIQFLLGWVGSF
jgi:hypothetical protein